MKDRRQNTPEKSTLRGLFIQHDAKDEKRFEETDKRMDERDASLRVIKEQNDLQLKKFVDLATIVEEKLLPAYEREQEKSIVVAYLKREATSWSFWIAILGSFAGLFLGIIYVIKQFLK